jgi:hypothetical protein
MMKTTYSILLSALVAVSAPWSQATGEDRLKFNWVMDQEASMPIYGFQSPADWQFHSEVKWNLSNTSVPVVMAALTADPEKSERIQFMPNIICYWLTGDAAVNPGGRNLGMFNAAPMPADKALTEAYTKLFRNDVTDLRITGVKQIPGLVAKLNQPGLSGQGVGLRAEYTLNGIPVEEEAYGLYVLERGTLRGEAGVTHQTTWGIQAMHSFTAPRGTLDQRRGFFNHMLQSVQINPAWTQYYLAVKHKLDNDFARNIAANRAARERIMARSRALAVQNEAFRSNIMARHRAAMDTSSHDRFIAGIHESSSHDRYIDSIHDVETFHDPQWGTSKHGYARQHWTDGSGNYIHSDDLNHDPNIGSQVEWTQMERVR